MNPARNFFILVLVFFALWGAFNLWPAIDLRVSSWFYHDDEWIGGHEPFATLREIYYRGSLLLALYLVILAVLSFWRETLVPKFFYRFFSVLAVIGNFLIVNRGFKEFFGRARPYKVEQFGGDAIFTPPPFLPVDQCSSNCSFVSGEASGAMILILSFVALCGANKRAKIWVWILIMPMAIMRIMAGKHFLSDVVMSMVLTAALYWLQLWICKRDSRALWSSLADFWRDFKGLFRRNKRES